MGILQSLSYTINVLKKSFLLCLQEPALFLFPFFILGFVLTIVLMAEGIFYSVIYQYCFEKANNCF